MKSRKQLSSMPLILMAVLLVTTLACSLTGKTASPSDEQGNPEITREAAPLEQPISKDECYHPYYPVKQGASWVYEMSGTVTDTYTHSIPSAGDGEFVDQDTFSGGTSRTGGWECDNGNLITLTPGGSASVAASGQTFDFTVTSNSGITLPAKLEVGSTWSQEIAYEGTQDAGGMTVTSVNHATISCTATGRESVTVPSGTYEAIRVECNNKLSISISGAAPIVLELPSTVWYAEGIGMIKSVSTGSGFDTTIVLKSYQIP